MSWEHLTNGSIRLLKAGARAGDPVLVQRAVQSLKAGGLTDRECFRIALAGSSTLTQEAWADLTKVEGLGVLVPPGMRLRKGGLRSAPKRVKAAGYPVGAHETVEREGRLYSVRICEEAERTGSRRIRTVAIVHRLT